MTDKLKRDIDREIKVFLAEADKKYGLNKISPLLFSGIKDFLMRPGKRIRPILFILAYEGYSKKSSISPRELIRASLSIELLHDFLLIHDDIIDRSELRRGRPAMHKFFGHKLGVSPTSGIGEGLGIVAGDIIYALAMEAFLASDETLRRKEKALKELIAATVFTGVGEFIDITGGSKSIDLISRKEIFDIYTLKTAKYTFEGPMRIGAALAGAKDSELNKLSKLGIILGRAFQILDDMLDIFMTSKNTGKPILSDLSESKKTLLAREAYHRLDSASGRIFKRLFTKINKTKRDLERLKKLIKNTDAPEYCLATIYGLLEEAGSVINGLGIKKRQKDTIAGLVKDLHAKTKTVERSI